MQLHEAQSGIISFSQLQKKNLIQKEVNERMFYNSFEENKNKNQNMFETEFGIINHLNSDIFNMKNEQMMQFIKDRTLQNCEQRSDQWYMVRKASFGGSEIANLMGNCKKKYKSQKAFLLEKVNKLNGIQDDIIPTQNQLIMDWGTFFEPLHRNIIEQLFKCQVIETSLCLGDGILKGCHQSPDGLAVINSKIFKEFVKCDHIQDQQLFDQEYITVLLEQKCPTLRKPQYGIVPENYIGQIKLGLSIFDICDIGCYSDSVIRICNTQQLFTNTFNTNIILSKKVIDNQPIFIGFIILDDETRQLMQQVCGDISNKINDSIFAYMMTLFKDKKCKVSYEIHKYSNNHQFKNMIKSRSQELSKTNAFICWKLVDLTFTSVERSNGFKNILSMFIQIGRNIIKQEKQSNNNDQQNFIIKQSKDIKKLTTLIEKMPMTPENHQDMWYNEHKFILLNQFKLLINYEWEPSNVLINLLQSSNDNKLTTLLNDHILQLYKYYKNDPIQINQLFKLLYSTNIDIYHTNLFSSYKSCKSLIQELKQQLSLFINHNNSNSGDFRNNNNNDDNDNNNNANINIIEDNDNNLTMPITHQHLTQLISPIITVQQTDNNNNNDKNYRQVDINQQLAISVQTNLSDNQNQIITNIQQNVSDYQPQHYNQLMIQENDQQQIITIISPDRTIQRINSSSIQRINSSSIQRINSQIDINKIVSKEDLQQDHIMSEDSQEDNTQKYIENAVHQ